MIAHVLVLAHDAKGRRNKVYYFENAICVQGQQFSITLQPTISSEASWTITDGLLSIDTPLHSSLSSKRIFPWYDLKIAHRSVEELMSAIEGDPILISLQGFLSTRV